MTKQEVYFEAYKILQSESGCYPGMLKSIYSLGTHIYAYMCLLMTFTASGCYGQEHCSYDSH